MEFKNLLSETIAKQKKITQPTDILTNDDYLVVNNQVSRFYGPWFSLFISAILTKFQALSQNENFLKNSQNPEFWFTINDCFTDHGISYYHQRMARKLGEELGLWKVEIKFNPKFPKSIINKTTHYTINWDNVLGFFDKIDKNEIEQKTCIQNQESLEKEAQKEEIEYQDSQADQDIATIDERTVIEYAKIMSSQPSIPDRESYKLKIIRNALNGHKITLKNIEIWLKIKDISSDFNQYDQEFNHLKYKTFYHENIPYQIIGVLKGDERYLIYGISNNHKKEIVFIKNNVFDKFVSELI